MYRMLCTRHWRFSICISCTMRSTSRMCTHTLRKLAAMEPPPNKRLQTSQRICPHCHEIVSYKTYRAHKTLYCNVPGFQQAENQRQYWPRKNMKSHPHDLRLLYLKISLWLIIIMKVHHVVIQHRPLLGTEMLWNLVLLSVSVLLSLSLFLG